MKRLTVAALSILMGVVASMPAHAACTLNADPAQNLTGTWAFQVTGTLTSDVITKIFLKTFLSSYPLPTVGAGATTIPGGGAIAGTFTVTGAQAVGRGGAPLGAGLSVLASTNLSNANVGGGLYGASVFQGVYSIDGLCDRGTIQLSSGTPNLASPFDFYFTNLAKTEMFLIGMQSENVFSGIAKKII